MSLELDEHRHFLQDAHRIDAFRQAIAEVVKPGAVVVDLGSGTGASTHVPVLGSDAAVDRHALGAMTDGRSLGDIARELLTRFPGRFRRFEAALDHVGDLSVRYKA